ncbi:MAG: acyl-CoA thioesterase [Chitinophagales bacterium]|nr:acyl-CoA thioesterase [Chitinophagales bacterium]MDW8418196.1 thioesterase family protein [Chitinophagales bacterium]
MYVYEHTLRVRYGDTDQMGYVYYGKYAYYYEQARAESIRALGITYKQLEQSGTMMPITRMNIRYIYPAQYDDLLTIRVTIPELPGRLITFRYEIYNENKRLINEGENQLIFLDAATRKPKRAPDELIKKLLPYFAGDVP